MKANLFIGPGRMEIQELPSPTPARGEVLIRVKACGICGTDQHIYHGLPGSANVAPPIVLGHELSGIVESVGQGVTEWKPGDRVSVDPNMYCRTCDLCRSGKYHLCRNLQAVGVTENGGMAELCVVAAANCYTLPDELSFEEGAMIEPLGCVLHGISLLHVRPGASALVIGGGYIGLMMLQVLKLLGAAPIIVSEPSEEKRRQALALGAEIALHPKELVSQLGKLGGGADLVVECVGREETMEAAVQSAGKGGQVLLFGVSSPSASIRVSPFEIFAKELTIRGSFINPHTHDEAISLVAQGKILIKPLISHRFKLDEVPERMDEYAALAVMKGIILL